jgi:hypothetical protein
MGCGGSRNMHNNQQRRLNRKNFLTCIKIISIKYKDSERPNSGYIYHLNFWSVDNWGELCNKSIGSINDKITYALEILDNDRYKCINTNIIKVNEKYKYMTNDIFISDITNNSYLRMLLNLMSDANKSYYTIRNQFGKPYEYNLLILLAVDFLSEPKSKIGKDYHKGHIMKFNISSNMILPFIKSLHKYAGHIHIKIARYDKYDGDIVSWANGLLCNPKNYIEMIAFMKKKIDP